MGNPYASGGYLHEKASVTFADTGLEAGATLILLFLKSGMLGINNHADESFSVFCEIAVFGNRFHLFHSELLPIIEGGSCLS